MANQPIKIKNGTIFFLVGMVNNKFANFWIYSLLSPLETKNYAYTLSITGNILSEQQKISSIDPKWSVWFFCNLHVFEGNLFWIWFTAHKIMSLIKCRACGNSVSKRAPACPSCGEPLRSSVEKSHGAFNLSNPVHFIGVLGFILFVVLYVLSLVE